MSDVSNVRYLSVRNPLVAYQIDYVKNTNNAPKPDKGSRFRADLNDIADKVELTTQVNQSIESGDSEQADAVNDAAQALGLGSGKVLLENLKRDGVLGVVAKYAEGLGLVIATDDLSRLTDEKQRAKETMQYKWNKFWAWGDGSWAFRNPIQVIPQAVKDLLGIGSPQASSGKLTEAQMENLKERLEVLANDETSPYHHLAKTVKSAIDQYRTNTGGSSDIKTYLNDLLTSYAGAVDDLKALAPQLENDEITSEDLLKQAITIITSAEYTMKDDKDQITALPTALDNLFNVLAGFDPSLAILVQTFSSEFNENETLTQYLRRTAGLDAEVLADVVAGGTEQISNDAVIPPAVLTPDSTSNILIGKRILGHKGLVNLPDKALIRDKWIEEGSIKNPTPKYLLSQKAAEAFVDTQGEDLPEQLLNGLSKVVTYLNDGVISKNAGAFTDGDFDHIDQILSSLHPQMLKKRGFFDYITIKYEYDITAGLFDKK